MQGIIRNRGAYARLGATSQKLKVSIHQYASLTLLMWILNMSGGALTSEPIFRKYDIYVLCPLTFCPTFKVKHLFFLNGATGIGPGLFSSLPSDIPIPC
jgi:hypothetical protein